ncbi:MAG: choice-of-anchor L domain-containing protein [Rhizobacter sp.]|nr:choice-of-anchor L domain-containing protein [Rhizobacter sp.]
MRLSRSLGGCTLPLISATLLAWSTHASAGATVTQLVDTTPASASGLVNALVGPGILVVPGSAQYQGAASASGTFTNGGLGPNGLGIDQGVVLTTGDARFIGSSAAFPGDSSNKATDFTAGVGNSLTPNTSPGNPLFAAMAPAGTFNASLLSFQFVPQTSLLSVTFVFGSEDYSDVINTGFPSDVFGIFVNGVNYALVPGTSQAISTSTINCGGPTSGAAPGSGPNCGLYRDNPPFSENIDSEVDGMTVALSLSIPINRNVVNSFAVGIADQLDSSSDSALMLKMGSVAAVPEPSTYALLAAGGFLVSLVARRRRELRR